MDFGPPLLDIMREPAVAAILMATHDLFPGKAETGNRIGIMNRGKLMR